MPRGVRASKPTTTGAPTGATAVANRRGRKAVTGTSSARDKVAMGKAGDGKAASAKLGVTKPGKGKAPKATAGAGRAGGGARASAASRSVAGVEKAAPKLGATLSKEAMRLQIEKLERAGAMLRARNREAVKAAKASAARVAELEHLVADLEQRQAAQDVQARAEPVAAKPRRAAAPRRTTKPPADVPAGDLPDLAAPDLAAVDAVPPAVAHLDESPPGE